MRKFLPALVTGLVLWAPGSAVLSAPAALGANLLRNPSAEAPAEDAATPGWTGPEHVFSVEEYGHVGGEWDWGLSGCDGCGTRYFRLQFEGDQDQQQAAEQTVDISALAADVDTGKVVAQLSGELGGYRDSDTTVWIEAAFEDGGGRVLGTLRTENVDTCSLPTPERGSTSLAAAQAQGPVPAGARSVRFRLVAKPTGASGSYLGLADQLSLLLRR